MVASGLALVLAALWPAAEKPDFPVEVVESGYPRRILQGSGRGGFVLPFHLELRSTKDAPVHVIVEGEVRASEGAGRRLFTRRVDVPPRTTVRAELDLVAEPEATAHGPNFFPYSFSIMLKAEGKILPLAEGQWTANVDSDTDTPAVLIAGRKTSDPRSLWGAAEFSIGDRTLSADAIDHLDAKHLPGSWMGYLSADTLLLDGLDGDALDARQRDAIRAWVWQGGWVIFSGDKTGAVLRGELFRGFFEEGTLGDAPLETAESPRDLTQVVLVEKEKSVDVKAPAATGEEPSPLVLLDPFQRSGEREIVDRSGPTPRRLYTESRFGAGRVGWLTPTSESLERASISFRQRLWALILAPQTSKSGVPNFSPDPRLWPLIHRALAKSLSRRVGTWLITGFVVVYLLVVGPGAYWVLRRRKKLHWIVWVEPLVVLVSVGIFVSTAYLAQGLLSRSRIVSVVTHTRGEPFASQSVIAGVFSGRAATMRIEAPQADLLWGSGERGTSLSLRSTFEQTQEGFIASGFPIEHWETAVFHATRVRSTPPSEGVFCELRFAPGGEGRDVAEIRVANRLKVPIRAVYVRMGSDVLSTPALAPSQEFRLRPPFESFDLSNEGRRRPSDGAGDTLAVIAALIEDSKSYYGDCVVAVLERGEGEILFDPAPVLENRLDLWVEIQTP